MRRMSVVSGRLFLVLLTVAGLASCAAPPASQAHRYEPAIELAKLHGDRDLTVLNLQAYQQTTDYTCGAAALVTLLKHYGRVGEEMQIAKEAGCTEEKGLSPQKMVAWLDRSGFAVQWGENGTLEMLRENLRRGVPTIVEWIDWGGHWVLVIGYDTRGTQTPDDDVILFADPADCWDGRVDGVSCFNASRFEAMWFDAFLFDRPMHKVYVTAAPKAR